MPDQSHIYILDDDELYAELLLAVVEGNGIPVTAKTNATDFLNSDLPQSFMLVLDLVMPEMDGIEVIRALAKKKYDVSLILISGFDNRMLHSAQLFAEAHNMKVLSCFTKPIDVHVFSRFIDAFWSKMKV